MYISVFFDFEKEKHAEVTAVFDDLLVKGTVLCVSLQILREFYSITTRHSLFNRPLSPDDAFQKIHEFDLFFTVFNETLETFLLLKKLLKTYKVTFGKVHDMNIAATVLSNSVDCLWTYNTKDFSFIHGIKLFQQ